MSFLKKLFGGGAASESKAASVVEHKDYRITPSPIREGSKYRICAMIEKDVEGEVKTHKLIRADTVDDAGQAAEISIEKAKAMIDQMGDGVFR